LLDFSSKIFFTVLIVLCCFCFRFLGFYVQSRRSDTKLRHREKHFTHDSPFCHVVFVEWTT